MINNFWRESERAKLAKLWATGMPIQDIAQELPGRTVSAIHKMRQEMRLPPRKPQYRRSPSNSKPKPKQRVQPMLAAQIIAFRDPIAKAPEKPKYVAMPIAYAKTCQWIEGDPRKNGGPCFCHGPVYRESWCLTHWDRVHGYSEAAD